MQKKLINFEFKDFWRNLDKNILTGFLILFFLGLFFSLSSTSSLADCGAVNSGSTLMSEISKSSSSTSSSESMVIDAFFQRLNGIEHDILMFRFDEIQSEAIVQEYFVERTQLVDEIIYDLYKNAVEILCVDGFPPELSQLRSELLRELAHFLCLSRGKRIKFTFEILFFFLFSLISSATISPPI